VLRGGADIGKYFQETCAARIPGASVALRPQHFTADDRVASETGTFHESRDGNPQELATGVYVTIYARRPGGEWRIAMELRTRGRDKQLVRW
jgi:ketosteroid isomerase-like protein